jgi:electron transfer flavoprotein alpha subunit
MRGIVAASQEILIFSERPDVTAELLAASRELAPAQGGGTVALITGGDASTGSREAPAEDAIAHGADTVLLATGETAIPDDPGTLTDVLDQAVRAVRPSIVLLGSTRVGAEIAARLAQRLGVASASACLALEWDPAGGDLTIDRLVLGGKFITRRVLRMNPRIAAVQVRRFEPLRAARRSGQIREFPVRLSPSPVTVTGVARPERDQADIGKADILVAAGRGVRSPADLALLESLARALGGELAASRPLVDMNWVPRDRLVGISGRMVRPKLYLACGISGQAEHIAGMRGARTVVAINSDPEAPIFQQADYCIVGDLYEIVPALADALSGGLEGGGQLALSRHSKR